jgi:hypothetical protein
MIYGNRIVIKVRRFERVANFLPTLLLLNLADPYLLLWKNESDSGVA